MKFFKFLSSLLLVVVLSNVVFASSYSRPSSFQFITDVPITLKSAWDMSFNTKKETLYAWSGVFLSTALFYYYDEEILDEFQRLGRKLDIGNKDNTTTMIQVGDIPIFRAPTDKGSLMYFIGDGWTQAAIALGFISNGLISDSNRALTTGSQIFNGMISSTIVNQIAKRSFGRESPYVKTRDRGRWRLFPSFSEYNNKTSQYDAMPSGHIMTSTMTLIIINENYPEHSHWVVPIGASLISLLGFQMINNGVHWMSDYPLGIMMGYVFGKAAVQSHNPKASEKSSWNYFPIFDTNEEEKTYGLYATYSF